MPSLQSLVLEFLLLRRTIEAWRLDLGQNLRAPFHNQEPGAPLPFALILRGQMSLEVKMGFMEIISLTG